MECDTKETKRHYATLVDESVRERDVLTNCDETGWPQPPTATRRLAYSTDEGRELLLHGLSQIPLALAETTAKKDLVRPKHLADCDAFTFFFQSKMGLDPLMDPYAFGNYEITYSRSRDSWHVSVCWHEGMFESVQSVATGFETLAQCLDFVRAARSLGIVHWKAERADIATRRVIKRPNEKHGTNA